MTNTPEGVNIPNKLYVSGLRKDQDVEELKQYFSRYGTIIDCKVPHEPKKTDLRGFAFITFKEAVGAARALAACPHFINGGPLKVRSYREDTTDLKRIMPTPTAVKT